MFQRARPPPPQLVRRGQNPSFEPLSSSSRAPGRPSLYVTQRAGSARKDARQLRETLSRRLARRLARVYTQPTREDGRVCTPGKGKGAIKPDLKGEAMLFPGGARPCAQTTRRVGASPRCPSATAVRCTNGSRRECRSVTQNQAPG